MPALQFAVGLRLIRAGQHMAGLPEPDEFLEILGDELRPVVADDPGPGLEEAPLRRLVIRRSCSCCPPRMKRTLAALFLIVASVLHAEDPIRPNPRLTPGAVFPNVTVEEIMQKGYANRLNGGVRHVSARLWKPLWGTLHRRSATEVRVNRLGHVLC